MRRGLGLGHDFWLLLILMYEKIHEKCLFFEQLTDAVNELPGKRAIHQVCRLISLARLFSGRACACVRSYQTVMRVSSTQLGAVPSMVASLQVKPRTSSSLASHGKG